MILSGYGAVTLAPVLRAKQMARFYSAVLYGIAGYRAQ